MGIIIDCVVAISIAFAVIGVIRFNIKRAKKGGCGCGCSSCSKECSHSK